MTPVAELTGAALDWAVAWCEGLPLKKDPMGFARDAPGSQISGWWVWHINGPFLLVGRNRSQDGYAPSVDWAQGGPIIEREKIYCKPKQNGEWRSYTYDGKGNGVSNSISGETPLIAAMRCYVASKLGETIENPENL